MSPARRLLLQAVALVVVLVAAVVVLAQVLQTDDPPVPATDQAVAGPVLLVPGYGGATGAVEVLATALRAQGRQATVVPLPGDGTGDLALSVDALTAAVTASGAPTVDVIGYSAGGVVARLWARDNGERARRVVTLGSPHHGTGVAALGAALVPGACPLACQQLVPESDLLDGLNADDETPPGPQWLSVWTAQDETVTPPESARLDGAVNVQLQDVCPGLQVSHSQLPRDAVVTRIVAAALAAPAIAPPTAEVC